MHLTRITAIDCNVERQGITADLAGRIFMAVAAACFFLIALPVVVRGAPFADDYTACVGVAERGVLGFFAFDSRAWGLVRPMRLLEFSLLGPLCQRVPFGIIMLLPLGVTLSVAFLVRGLLRDLSFSSPWPEIGGGMWLLAPLGMESALWPSALHVPLGLGLTLIALRQYRRAQHVSATLAAIGACFSLEQVVFALPIATWLVTEPPARKRAAVISLIVSISVVTVYAAGHGHDARANPNPTYWIHALAYHPERYLLVLPGVGLGLQSIPLAVKWAWPFSIVVLLAGWIAGGLGAPYLLQPAERLAQGKWAGWRGAGVFALLVVLINLPMALNDAHQHSPRHFTPTWLALSILGAIVGSRVSWQNRRPVGHLAGLLVAAALLSLALSAWARIRTADVTEAALYALAARLPPGGTVAICDVRRAVVDPAPSGDFDSAHPFIVDSLTEAALQFYTGIRAKIRLGGIMSGSPCPDLRGADLVVRFPDLIARTGSR